MTDYTKPPVEPAWAQGGDKDDAPSFPEIQEGWPASNTPPTRQRFNWILNRLSEAVRYFMQMGIPSWDAADDYRAGSRVQTADGTSWKALRANTNAPPATSPSDWVAWGDLNRDQDIDLYSVGAVTRFLRLNKGVSTSPGTALKQWEIGADANGDLVLRAYSDAGALLGDALVFDRASGTLSLQAIECQGINMLSEKVTNLEAGTAAGDAVNKSQMDAADVATVANIGFGMVRGFTWSSPGNTTASLGCSEAIVFRNAAGKTRLKTGASITGRVLNISTAGPIAGGRDQAGAFASNAELHIFFIYNPTTDVTEATASLNALAPALPAGFTEWAYATSVKLSGTNIVQMYGRGNMMYFMTAIRLLSNGQATSEAPISAAFVPTVATSICYGFILEISQSTSGVCPAQVRPLGSTGAQIFVADTVNPGTPNAGRGASTLELPVINANPGVAYFVNPSPAITSGGFYIDQIYYRIRNGDA